MSAVDRSIPKASVQQTLSLVLNIYFMVNWTDRLKRTLSASLLLFTSSSQTVHTVDFLFSFTIYSLPHV